MKKLFFFLTSLFISSLAFSQDMAISENQYEKFLVQPSDENIKTETNASFVTIERENSVTLYNFNEKELYQSETIKKYTTRKEANDAVNTILAYFETSATPIVNTTSSDNQIEYIAVRKGEVFKVNFKEVSKSQFEVSMIARQVQNVPAEKRDKYDFLAL